MVADQPAELPRQKAYNQKHQPGASATVAQKKGIRLLRIKRKLISTDPQRLAILSRIRSLLSHLPEDGVMLFFDVKPVSVKAYGGRRYTMEKRLVLAKQQRTRGRFYLFLCYDLQTGRRRWAFLPGKSSNYVCQFMRQVRRWYPTQRVWVILDQDSAHPRKCCETRRVFRELGVNPTLLSPGAK